MLSDIRLITLDLDDTLWPCLPTIMQAEAQMYDWLQSHTPALVENHSPESLRAHRISLAKANPAMAHDLTRMRLQSLEQLMAQHGYSADHAEQANNIFRVARNNVEPYDEVVAALAELKPRFTLVSVTNGNSQIEHTPLADSFHLSLTAEMVGAAKPDPAIFHAAMEFAGVSVEQTLHVGDDPVRDVEAARYIGLKTVWVNRHDQVWPENLAEPDFCVQNMTQLNNKL